VGLQLCKFCIGPAAVGSTICRLATVQVGRVLYVSVLMSGPVSPGAGVHGDLQDSRCLNKATLDPQQSMMISNCLESLCQQRCSAAAHTALAYDRLTTVATYTGTFR
jgi:hypothetical protein